MKFLYGSFLAACLLTAPAFAETAKTEEFDPTIPAGEYQLDPSHASLVFQVNHIGFSEYTAGFDRFEVTLKLDPEHLEASVVSATIDPKSLDLPTPPEGFVADILGANWLNAGLYPSIRYTSMRVVSTGEKTAKVYGTLELLGQKQPVELDVTFNGGGSHPMDKRPRVGFSAHGTLKRSAFGMKYGLPAPGSKMGVGDVVSFRIETELTHKTPSDAAAVTKAVPTKITEEKAAQ